jgi:hypothetical protein
VLAVIKPMTQETIKYEANLRDFQDRLKNSRVERIYFDIDKEPTFDKAKLPFNFKYCHSIKVVTNSEIFIVHTSTTDSGLDTFWIVPKTQDDKIFDSSQQINLNVKAVLVKNGFANLPFKIELDFDNSKILIYAAEIYDRADGKLDCRMNEEMILVFEMQKDAGEFEKMIDYG